MQEIWVTSSFDGTEQPSLFYHPGCGRVPLVVGLHTWSFSRDNQTENYLPLCRKYGWALLLPEFRGPNLAANLYSELACGSQAVRQDIADAVKHVTANFPIDPANVFLLGCSGGGQAALLAAVFAPKLYRAVDVWCPVTDLTAWHDFLLRTKQHYIKDIETCLGGTPVQKPEEYLRRSPASVPDALAKLTLLLHHGRHDAIVPYEQSMALVQELERRAPESFYFDFFDGGHEQFPAHSFEWFARLAGTGDTARRISG